MTTGIKRGGGASKGQSLASEDTWHLHFFWTGDFNVSTRLFIYTLNKSERKYV